MAIGYREDPTTSNFLKSKGGHIRHIVTYLNNLLALSTTNILLKGLDRLPNFVAQVPLEASRSEWDRALIPKAFVKVVEEQSEKCLCQHMSRHILPGYSAAPVATTHVS